MNWLPIVGYEGKYEVSDCGDVRRTDGREVGQWSNGFGYMVVRLSRPRAQLRVHRAVALAFIPNPLSLPCVNHLDNDPASNRVENLEWCTQRQNIQHAARQGRMPGCWKGKRSPTARFSDDTAALIRDLYAAGGTSWRLLAKRFGVSKNCIAHIIKGKTYV